jgi:hypothetical protein
MAGHDDIDDFSFSSYISPTAMSNFIVKPRDKGIFRMVMGRQGSQHHANGGRYRNH